MRHYTSQELEAYRSGAVSILSGYCCKKHLEHCPRCRKILRELISDDQLLSQFAAGLLRHEKAREELRDEG